MFISDQSPRALNVLLQAAGCPHGSSLPHESDDGENGTNNMSEGDVMEAMLSLARNHVERLVDEVDVMTEEMEDEYGDADGQLLGVEGRRYGSLRETLGDSA